MALAASRIASCFQAPSTRLSTSTRISGPASVEATLQTGLVVYPLLALTAVVAGTLMTDGVSPVVAGLATLGVGAAIGVFNGVLVCFFGFSTIIKFWEAFMRSAPDQQRELMKDREIFGFWQGLLRVVGSFGDCPRCLAVCPVGNDYHAYLAEVAFRKSVKAHSAVYQATCSPFRNPLSSKERRAVSAGFSRAGGLLAGAVTVGAYPTLTPD